MSTIKLKRGTGTPAGSLAQFEVAMDVAAKNLYVSTNGSDAVVLADNTINTLSALPQNTISLSGSAQGLSNAVLNIKTDNSGYNRSQIMFEDSNGKAFSLVGEANTTADQDKFVVTLDPDNLHSPTNQANYAGDYGVYYLKDYNDVENPSMNMNVFGAKDGFKIKVFDDNNGGSPNPGPLGYGGYGYKPLQVYADTFEVHAKLNDTQTTQVLKVDETEALFDTKLYMNNKQLTTNASGFSKTAVFRRTTTNSTTNAKAGGSFQSEYKDSFNGGSYVAPTAGAGAATGWLVNGGFMGALICDLDTVAVNADNSLDAANSKAKFEVRLYTDGANQQTGETVFTASHDAVIAGKPFENVSLSADPSSPVNGWQYYNTATHKLRLYANGAWVDLN